MKSTITREVGTNVWRTKLVRPADIDYSRAQLSDATGYERFCEYSRIGDWFVTVRVASLVAPRPWQGAVVLLIVDDAPRGSLIVYPDGTAPGPWLIRVPRAAAMNVIVSFYQSTADAQTRDNETLWPAHVDLRLTRVMSMDV